MELLEGEALSERLDRLGQLSVAEALRIARQVAGALAAAHAHDIIHRDLKPENIFLVADAEAEGGERAKILDFGICKIGSDASDVMLTQTGAMIGTPVYMSPEQCRGAGGIDPRSDIYALGCLMFHMVTGRPPFVRDAPGELIVAHMHEEPPAPSVYTPGLPAAVDELLLRCLAKAPGDRFQSMTSVQHALGELYVELDHAEAAVASVTPAVPLGRGFRSVYDGNFASHPGGFRNSASTQARMPWLKFAPTPATPDSEDSAIQPPRRSRLRAALTGVLVAGVLAGFGTTAFVIYDTSDSSADPISARETAPAPATADRHREDSEARRLQVARTVKPERPSPAPVVTPAATAEPAAPPAVVATDAAPAPTRAVVTASEPTPAADGDATAGEEATAQATVTPADVAPAAAPIERTPPIRRSSSLSAERVRRPREATREKDKPITSPRTRTPAPMPPIPAYTPATPVVSPAASAPVTSPAAAPTEDLYDTR
jgi:serine/threonine-protein kinase